MPPESRDYEKFIESFLMNDRAMLIAPQYEIRVRGEMRYPDILAVKTDKKVFYLVEITLSGNTSKLKSKLAEYTADAANIARCLCIEFSFGDGWSVVPVFFVRTEYLAKFQEELGEGSYMLRAVEETMKRPEAGYLKIHKAWSARSPV